jgi:hypothetical protein
MGLKEESLSLQGSKWIGTAICRQLAKEGVELHVTYFVSEIKEEAEII